MAIGVAGLAFALFGFGMGMLRADLLAPFGVVLPLLGLFYLVAFVGSRGTSDDVAYAAGAGIGLGGALVFLIALGRSFYPWIVEWLRPGLPAPADYFVPAGILLMLFGLLYVVASILLCSDNVLVILVRRELGAFFFSPIFYLVLFAITFAHWLGYALEVNELKEQGFRAPEPVVRLFALNTFVLICNIFVVPALTMRLLSEEQRSGTLEVLLTAPVTESNVVLSKFLAGLLFYLLLWVPGGLLILCLRLMVGTDFDYKPLLSFGLVLVVTASMFIAVGLLCSSLAREQITSGVLCFVAILALTLLQVFLPESVRDHFNYLSTWANALAGKIVIRTLLFPISLTILCLFLTVKVLESRKWK
jgi:ABC-2 type transport system permease protein